jgi:transcriptional regulator with XRE-family HTH domain
MDIGERILQTAKDVGMNQATLAEKLGVNQSTVSKWGKGSFPIKSVKISDIAAVLGVTEEFLLTGYARVIYDPATGKYREGDIPEVVYESQIKPLLEQPGKELSDIVNRLKKYKYHISEMSSEEIYKLHKENQELKAKLASKNETIQNLNDYIALLKEKIVDKTVTG